MLHEPITDLPDAVSAPFCCSSDQGEATPIAPDPSPSAGSRLGLSSTRGDDTPTTVRARTTSLEAAGVLEACETWREHRVNISRRSSRMIGSDPQGHMADGAQDHDTAHAVAVWSEVEVAQEVPLGFPVLPQPEAVTPTATMLPEKTDTEVVVAVPSEEPVKKVEASAVVKDLAQLVRDQQEYIHSLREALLAASQCVTRLGTAVMAASEVAGSPTTTSRAPSFSSSPSLASPLMLTSSPSSSKPQPQPLVLPSCTICAARTRREDAATAVEDIRSALAALDTIHGMRALQALRGTQSREDAGLQLPADVVTYMRHPPTFVPYEETEREIEKEAGTRHAAKGYADAPSLIDVTTSSLLPTRDSAKGAPVEPVIVVDVTSMFSCASAPAAPRTRRPALAASSATRSRTSCATQTEGASQGHEQANVESGTTGAATSSSQTEGPQATADGQTGAFQPSSSIKSDPHPAEIPEAAAMMGAMQAQTETQQKLLAYAQAEAIALKVQLTEAQSQVRDVSASLQTLQASQAQMDQRWKVASAQLERVRAAAEKQQHQQAVESEAKDEELRRLRILMRFSELKKDSDMLPEAYSHLHEAISEKERVEREKSRLSVQQNECRRCVRRVGALVLGVLEEQSQQQQQDKDYDEVDEDERHNNNRKGGRSRSKRSEGREAMMALACEVLQLCREVETQLPAPPPGRPSLFPAHGGGSGGGGGSRPSSAKRSGRKSRSGRSKSRARRSEAARQNPQPPTSSHGQHLHHTPQPQPQQDSQPSHHQGRPPMTRPPSAAVPGTSLYSSTASLYAPTTSQISRRMSASAQAARAQIAVQDARRAAAPLYQHQQQSQLHHADLWGYRRSSAITSDLNTS